MVNLSRPARGGNDETIKEFTQTHAEKDVLI